MGELYLAEKPGIAGFSKQVVVKRIRPDMVHDNDFVEMFLNEGRLASMFTHPNIVQIYELGQVGNTYFMAMEYVPGRNLGDIIERRSGPVELPYALYILTQLLEGLGSAHDARDNEGRAMRLVHRDISPPNVLISFSGAVKLTDFGIAKVARQSRQTQAGVLKGKFAYLSPEQAMGEPIDRRSDLYALGLVLFEATVGRRANPGAVEVEQIYAASQGRVLQPSLHDHHYPPDLERIFLKATAKAPRDRYQSAREMHRDLVDFQGRNGMHVTANVLGAFLQRTFPEEAFAPPAAAESSPHAVRSYSDADFDDGPAAFDTLPPPSAQASHPVDSFDTSPTGYPSLGRGMGFEDEEATVMEQTLPPEDIQTLDSSSGMVVMLEDEEVSVPSLPDLSASYGLGYTDFDEDEETRVAPPRPIAELLEQSKDGLPRLDLLDPTQETDIEPGLAMRRMRETGPPIPSPLGYGVADANPFGSFSSPPPASLPLGSVSPSRPDSLPLRPPPAHVAEPLPTAPEPRSSRGRSIFWLVLGLLIVVAIATAATFLVIRYGSGGDLTQTSPELPVERKGVQVSPLEGS